VAFPTYRVRRSRANRQQYPRAGNPSVLRGRKFEKSSKGEPVDAIIALPDLVDALMAAGLVIPDSRTPLVRRTGIEVRNGAPKPEVSTVDAFNHAMLTARSLGYLKTPAGVHLDQVSSGGIADSIRAKAARPDTVLFRS
jgi:hypothetical protein